MLSRRATALLMVTFLVLAGLYWLVQQQQTQEQADQPTMTPIPYVYEGLDPDAITWARVEHLPSGYTAYMRRGEDGAWQFEASAYYNPDAIPVQSTLDSAVSHLTRLEYDLKLEGQDLQGFGLAPTPFYRVTFRTSEREYVLAVGGMNPRRTGYYVMAESDRAVYLVPARFISSWVGVVENPPFATITPTPSPTPAVSPTLEISPTFENLTPTPQATD